MWGYWIWVWYAWWQAKHLGLICMWRCSLQLWITFVSQKYIDSLNLARGHINPASASALQDNICFLQFICVLWAVNGAKCENNFKRKFVHLIVCMFYSRVSLCSQGVPASRSSASVVCIRVYVYMWRYCIGLFVSSVDYADWIIAPHFAVHFSLWENAGHLYPSSDNPLSVGAFCQGDSCRNHCDKERYRQPDG